MSVVFDALHKRFFTSPGPSEEVSMVNHETLVKATNPINTLLEVQ